MFARIKKLKTAKATHEYVQIVESYRESGKSKQRIIGTIGRLDRLLERGSLDGLIESLCKFSKTLKVVRAAKEGSLRAQWARQWGPALVFDKLWSNAGLSDICHGLTDGRAYRFDMERAILACVLQRLMKPGSDLSCTRWLDEVYGPGFEALRLQHLYRAMDFLDAKKEQVEQELFWRGRDLFDYGLDLVFFDTTSVYFEGDGPEGLAAHGYSRDRKSDKVQLLLGVIMSREGWPLCCEFWPGNTADPKTLKKAVESLKGRFRLGRIIVGCDRGMVSVKNLVELEEAGLEYIVGVPLRRYPDVREEVLADKAPYCEVAPNLFVKEVHHCDLRFVVCHNPDEAKREREARRQMAEKLKQMLSERGPKALIGNSGYRKFLRIDKKGVFLDEGKMRSEELYDGKFVLLTNTELSADDVATSYKGLWRVERAFRDLKNLFKVRPIYHRRKQRVKGHIFCTFLALYLKVALEKALESKGLKLAWEALLGDLRSLKAVKLHLDGSIYLLRTDFQGSCNKVFRAVGLKSPPTLQPYKDA
jgi:hypothetical protein